MKIFFDETKYSNHSSQRAGIPASKMQHINDVKKRKIELSISCRGLNNLDYLSRCDHPFTILYEKNSQEQWIEKERTEEVAKNINPNFTKTFIMDYIFEKHQHIKFEVFNVESPKSFDFIGDSTTTLAKIMGSKSQMLILELTDKLK